jgi:hypothetical protein
MLSEISVHHGGEGVAEESSSHVRQEAEQEKQKRVRTKCSHKNTPPVTYFLQLGPTS